MTPAVRTATLGLALLAVASAAGEPAYEEFRVKRQAVFEFARPPRVTREGDRYEIRFETKGFCDVTVAVEDAKGRIIRHLACGVLGRKAPPPFQKGSKKQAIIWDGKDDQGRYVTDPAGLTVRVSLGLRARFERTLHWSPRKRIGAYPPLVCADGGEVFVCEGRGVDHLRVFRPDGKYVRTVYPFPAGKLGEVRGLKMRTYPQDGARLPVKLGFVQATLLTCGTSSVVALPYKFGDGFGASAMAVRKGRIALAHLRLNRLSADGSTGGLALAGGKTSITVRRHRKDVEVIPSAAALSPDGKTLYLAGYFWKEPRSYMYNHYCLPVVMKLAYDRDADAEVFLGGTKLEEAGTDDRHFKAASSVAVDEKGRVYVADYPNDRVQVFSPAGEHLETIRTPRPAQVRIHPGTGEIFVFSWMVPTDLVVNEEIRSTVTRFGPADRPRKISSAALPLQAEKLSGYYRLSGLRYSAELVVRGKAPTVWIAGPKGVVTKKLVSDWGMGVLGRGATDQWLNSGILVLGRADGKWTVKQSFAAEAQKEVVRVKPAAFSRQRLYVNPVSGKLYVADDRGFGKSFTELLQIDPATGKAKLVPVPFDSEDLAFDLDGMAYLRTDTLVARYNARTWREVPWDYGENHLKVGFSSLGGGRRADLTAALRTPGQRPVFWHQGGMWINAKGHLAVSSCSRAKGRRRNVGVRFRAAPRGAKPYTPAIYPGRVRWQEIHVWDRHGKLIHEDAVPGIGITDGLGLDRDGNLYLMAANARVFGEKRYPNIMSGTMMKFAPGKARILGTGRAPVPLGESHRPARRPDVIGAPLGSAWVQGVEWLYGGVGYSGMISTTIGFGCACWNARFGFDYFARSFAPEIDHYSVAVLDSAGNLITRIGRYGNVDDGRPMVAAGGPAKTRSIGGDEVALFHAAYLAAHTDRRLFIADAGNGRVLSVKLEYHAAGKVRLKDVRDPRRAGE